MFKKDLPYNNLPLLPGKFDYNQIDFLKLAIKATGKLEKLNGLMYLLPNKNILISPMLIKESVESSAIENINTTTIKVLQSKALGGKLINGAEKEVLNYHDAILHGFEKLKKDGGIGYNFLIDTQSIIEPNKTGIRKISGTVIANNYGEILYTPPEGKENIDKLLYNLEDFMNNIDDDIDALIKMPVIHYQFESIHPFLDGNGRTGRILNVLYLILSKKLDFPILFLSEYINKTKTTYYKLLNQTSKTGDYSDFIIYLLKGVIQQADFTAQKILKIKELMKITENKVEKINLYYHKITNLLFSNPFVGIKDFEKNLNSSTRTVSRIIEKLEENDIVSSMKVGKNKLIFIQEFIELLS